MDIVTATGQTSRVAMLDLSRDGDVFVLRIDAGENRFTADLVRALGAALDEVAAAGAPAALVTTGTGKFYSNGLDLEEMNRGDRAHAEAYLSSVLGLLGRMLTLPLPTAAAVNGHAFGAGAQIAIAHDLQVMRADRGFFCMPEIDMRVPLHPGMVALLQARLPWRVAHEVIVSGTRYGGTLAHERGIVDAAVAEDQVVSRAVELVAPLAGKADPAMAVLKRSLYGGVLDALARPLAGIEGIEP